MNTQQQIHYWAHMLDEAFGANLSNMKDDDKFVNLHDKPRQFKMVEESGAGDASRKFESALYNLEQALYRKLSDGAYRYHDIEYILGEVRRMWNAQRDDAGRSAVLVKILDPEAFIKYWKGIDEGITSESKRQILYWAHMLDEAFNKEQFLCEDREGKNINRAEKWIKQNHPELIGKEINGRIMSRARDVVTLIRHDIPSARLPYDKDANGQLIKVKLSNGDIVDKGTCKYLPGICRIYLNDLSNKTLDLALLVKLTSRLSDLVNVVATQFDNDFREDDSGRDFNSMSFDLLEAKYGKHVEALKRREREEAKSSLGNTKKNEDYTIVSIDSFDDAEKFSLYVSWCITEDESYYNNYTASGENKFYFVIRKDFKTVSKEDPSYATSMLAILVNADGSMDSNNGCTSRLNNGGRFMDPKQVQNLLGVDFYKTFRPDDTDTIWKKLLSLDCGPENEEDRNFCRLFGCVRIDDEGIFLFKKIIDGKIVTLPYIDSIMTFIDGKFVTMKDGKLVQAAPKYIAPCAFLYNSSLKSIVIPDSVTSISEDAFCGCSGLTSVIIPNSVTSILAYAFDKCSGLTSITIPDSVTSIGRFAFCGCSGLTSVIIGNSVADIGNCAFFNCNNLKLLVFKSKTLEKVKAMDNYPFGIKDESIIKCEGGLNESKATYLLKYKDEADAKKIVDAFWQIKSRLSAPQNDIDWWIKKPFADLKSFVLNYNPANKKQRRDADYRKQALENDAKLLDTRDGYEIWYVPTYEAMRILGRFYKGRSAKWCVASDDPEFWFDNHDEDEFVVLVRELPKNDEFDKVALLMTGHGRYFNLKQIIPWDLENNDETFTARYYMTGLDLADVEDLIYYAWHLFKDNGELREQYYDVD